MVHTMNVIKAVFFIILLSFQGQALAAKLHLPIDCKLGESCWIANLPRHHIQGKQVDFRCGPNTYRNHKGTDIALRDLKQMKEGVNVLSPFDGEVKALRNKVDDVSTRDAGKKAIKGIECGNGVVIDSKDTQVQLCHLKKGSVKVKVGQKIKTGDVIGQVGLSGMTEYPHLHISVRQKVSGKYKEADPFYGPQTSCGLTPKPMWADAQLMEKHARTGVVYNYGFMFGSHNAKQIRSGDITEKQPSRPKEFIGFVDIFSVNRGDALTMSIEELSGKELVKRHHKFSKYQARYLFFIGKILRGNRLSGKYQLNIQYVHSSGEIDRFKRIIDL